MLAKGLEGYEETTVLVNGEDAGFSFIPADGAAGIVSGTEITAPELPVYIVPRAIELPGVYKVNNGYAEFERIFRDEDISAAEIAADYPSLAPVSTDSFQERGYTILDPALNPGLKTYDYIVTRASDVTERQIIN